MSQETEAIHSLLQQDEAGVLQGWLDEAGTGHDGTQRANQQEAREILHAMKAALAGNADTEQFQGPAWAGLRDVLSSISRSRAAQGKTAGDTSVFILAVKRPIFTLIQKRLASSPQVQVSALWALSSLVDQMAQWTVNTYQQSREDIIKRQQEELLELSTPVIKLWDGVLAVPMIGTLDSARTQVVMEALLQRIVDTGSQLAIIDITGVPTVDTLVAQHLLKTVSAIRLMGADCIISGIRPQIAQTIVHLGIDLQGIASKATLADALALALERNGFRVTNEPLAA
ncbi:STAS domain-containing protein [Ramlibacter sp. PS4R-6]|uniref:STAS domain-containing protein n=1 Tax=Ramlibacter sp. PS4R-6 TaxID=3133438 RepID=UPI00309CE623